MRLGPGCFDFLDIRLRCWYWCVTGSSLFWIRWIEGGRQLLLHSLPHLFNHIVCYRKFTLVVSRRVGSGSGEKNGRWIKNHCRNKCQTACRQEFTTPTWRSISTSFSWSFFHCYINWSMAPTYRRVRAECDDVAQRFCFYEQWPFVQEGRGSAPVCASVTVNKTNLLKTSLLECFRYSECMSMSVLGLPWSCWPPQCWKWECIFPLSLT